MYIVQIFYCEKIKFNESGLKHIPRLYFMASTNVNFFHRYTHSDFHAIIGSDLGCSMYSLVHGYQHFGVAEDVIMLYRQVIMNVVNQNQR
jgi:hypothetical protein